VDLNQIVNINRALSISGSTVQLSGFNFGFTAKNGNYWDDARQDYLSAYVKLYGSTGSQVASYDYTAQTNQKYNWTQFNFSETFATPYTTSKLSTAQVGFVGRDNNFWAGTYGPEIYNVNFSLTYSVKPAAPTYTAPAPTSTYTAPAPTSPPPTEAGPTLAQTSPQQQTQQTTQSSPSPTQDTTMTQMDQSQPGPTQAGPAPTNPQPAGGPAQTTTASSSNSSGPNSSGSSGPSKLAMSVVKSAQDKDKATQAQAVQNAAKALEGTQQSAQAASNAAISMNQEMSANSATTAAQFSSQSTQASQQTVTQSTQGPQQFQQSTIQQQQTSRAVQTTQQSQDMGQQQTFDSSTTSSVALKAPVITAIDTPVQASSGTGLTVNRNPFAYNPLATISTSNLGTSPTLPLPVYQPRLSEKVMELDTTQVAGFSGIGKAGNPLSEIIMQQRFELLQGNVEQQSSGVNRNVLPNELAGSIDLASMALQPKGFEAYSVVLKDTAFYEPKEVYRGQTVIDNARALRQLGSDRLHKEMVDSQYKLRN
jgi:hypothetical protein